MPILSILLGQRITSATLPKLGLGIPFEGELQAMLLPPRGKLPILTQVNMSLGFREYGVCVRLALEAH